MSVSIFDVVNARVGPDMATAGLFLGAKRLAMVSTGTTTDFSVDLPVGATLNTILAFTPTAATGAPTNANVTVGKTSGGAEYVAATDIKAAGKVALTFATANIADVISLPSNVNTSKMPAGDPSRVFARITFVGGTAPTVSATLIVEYTMPYTAPTDGHGL